MHPALAGRPVYLDYNATTPVDPRVVAALPAMTEQFGNPSTRTSTSVGQRCHRRRPPWVLGHAGVIETDPSTAVDACLVWSAWTCERRSTSS